MRSRRTSLIVAVLVTALSAGATAGEVAGKFAVTPQGGLVMPIQALQQTDGGGSAKLGFAGGVTAEYFINENIAVGGRFIFNRFGLDIENVDEGNWTILEFGIFGKYVFLPGNPTRPFARGGVIMGKAKQEVEEAEFDVSMSPGFEIAGGVMHEVAENISIYGEVGWTIVATDGADVDRTMNGSTDTFESEIHLQWIGVKAGATFFFGAK